MTGDPPRTWRIHLGVHKTATTHIQQTLEQLEQGLVAQGVQVVPVADLRALGLSSTLKTVVTNPGLRRVLRRRRAERALGRIVGEIRARGLHLVLSEENILGNAGDALAAPPYADAPARIALMLDRIPAEDSVALLLAVRSLDTLAPSAFAQSLRLKPPGRSFADLRPRLLGSPPSWADLVARIVAAAPRARLTVWRYEDYGAHRAAIVARLCGVDPGPLPDVPVPVRTRTPSRDAVAAAEALPRGLDGAAWRAEVARLFAASDPAAARFAPFTHDEAAALRAAYRADLDRIAALGPGVALMTFDGDPTGPQRGA